MSASRPPGCLFALAIGAFRFALNVAVLIAMAGAAAEHGHGAGVAAGLVVGAVSVFVSWRIVQPRAERLAAHWYGVPQADEPWSASSQAWRALSPVSRHLWLAQLVFLVGACICMWMWGSRT